MGWKSGTKKGAAASKRFSDQPIPPQDGCSSDDDNEDTASRKSAQLDGGAVKRRRVATTTGTTPPPPTAAKRLSNSELASGSQMVATTIGMRAKKSSAPHISATDAEIATKTQQRQSRDAKEKRTAEISAARTALKMERDLIAASALRDFHHRYRHHILLMGHDLMKDLRKRLDKSMPFELPCDHSEYKHAIDRVMELIRLHDGVVRTIVEQLDENENAMAKKSEEKLMVAAMSATAAASMK